MPTTPDILTSGLICEDEAPLHWEMVPELPSEQHLAALDAINETLIRSFAELEESQRSGEDLSELAHELQRLESKLDLIMDLLVQSLRRTESLPPVRSLRFNARGIGWATDAPPPPGALVRLDCYLSARFPKPLVMHGRVLDNGTGEIEGQTVAEFLGVSSGVAEELDRLVFRRHRREVARIRGHRQDVTEN